MWAIFPNKKRQKPPNECHDSSTVQFLSANDINDYDKFAAYDLYIDDQGLEDFMDCLEECKSQGCTIFISVEIGGFESYGRSQYCVLACKENNEMKLSQFVEQTQKRKNTNDHDMFHKSRLKSDELRSFLTKYQAEEYGRFDISINRAPPKLNLDISVRSKKLNISISQKTKRLKFFISERLAYPVLSYPTVDCEKLVQETTSLLKNNLKKLINGTPPDDIKEAYKAVLLQLSIFHQNRYSFLRNSSNTSVELSNLKETLNFVTTAIKCLNYGMKDGHWCVFGADQLSNTVEEAVISDKKQALTANTFRGPLQTENQFIPLDRVEEAAINNDAVKLNKLDANIDAIMKRTADPSLRVLSEDITALDAAEVELTAMRDKIVYDKIQFGYLNDIHAKVTSYLLKHIDRTVNTLKRGRNQIQAKLNTTVTKRQAEAVKIHNSADPRCFKGLADKIQKAIDADNGNIAFKLSDASQSLVKPLADIIPIASAVREAINSRHKLYLDFVEKLNNANNQLDISRQILDAFKNETLAGLRSLEAAEQEFEVLMTAHDDLSSQIPILKQLQKLSKELDPLNSVYANTRHVESDWGQLNQQFEDAITVLGNEIDAEKLINEGASEIRNEIVFLEVQIPIFDIRYTEA
uniref:Coiled-coil domain-containing protein 22 homolog n=1 Tax=Panagrellus redivivus TaxID=6233 RepID=A0A7E4W6F3_PANRE